jgi:predicted negative regulator of RcsB-dependent stress response
VAGSFWTETGFVSRARWMITLLVVLGLVALVNWQRHREAQMNACLSDGRAWNGPLSRCEAPRMGPLLRRALERS